MTPFATESTSKSAERGEAIPEELTDGTILMNDSKKMLKQSSLAKSSKKTSKQTKTKAERNRSAVAAIIGADNGPPPGSISINEDAEDPINRTPSAHHDVPSKKAKEVKQKKSGKSTAAREVDKTTSTKKKKKSKTNSKDGANKKRPGRSTTSMGRSSSPELDSTSRTSATSTSHEESESHLGSRSESSENARKHVLFSTVDVLEFEYSLGSGSVSSRGPPVSLSATLSRKQRFVIDTYEATHSLNRREEDDLLLSVKERKDILEKLGYTENEIEDAANEAKEIRLQRRKSVKTIDWDNWAATKELVGRKIRKLANPKALFTSSKTYSAACCSKTLR